MFSAFEISDTEEEWVGVKVPEYKGGLEGLILKTGMYEIKNYAKSGGMAVVKQAVGLVDPIGVTGLLQSGRRYVRSADHVTALEQIKLDAENRKYQCNCLNDDRGHLALKRHVLPYIIERKKRKTTKSALSMVPVVGSVATTGYNIANYGKKKIEGSKSVKRKDAALWLLGHGFYTQYSSYSQRVCPLAAAIILELLCNDAPTGSGVIENLMGESVQTQVKIIMEKIKS